ncbi:glycosyltransferase family 4 protein [Hoeflea sp.]|uniref:glycosyltransferase family 4 protein n=1 Tax=Hoeflea sp. TaxID=1940281 RepID=UPI003B0213A9
MASAFTKQGIFRSAEKLKIPDKKPTEKLDFPERMTEKSNIDFFHVNLDQLETVLIHRKLNQNKICIAYPVWELPTFPKEWLAGLFAIDDVMVPSNFVADNMLGAWGFRPFVLPHVISVNSAAPAEAQKTRHKLGLTDQDIVILLSFDLDSYFQRKNPIGALRAIKLALSHYKVSRPIKVIVKLHGTDHEKSISKIREFELANVILVDEVQTAQEYEALQEVSDIFLSLHRSEGFGLNIAEMMARGKLVVTTRYSGNLDYCTDNNSMLVDCRFVPVGSGEYPHHSGGWWAEPSNEDAAHKLGQAIKLVEERDLRLAAQARTDLAQGFRGEVVAKRFLQFIDDKVEWLHGQRTTT